MASLTRAERETIINFKQESDLVSVYTHDQALIRQLERRGFASVRQNVYGGRVVAKTFEVPKDVLSIRVKSKRTSAQRAAVVANLRKAREGQKTINAMGVSQRNSPKTGETPSASVSRPVAPEDHENHASGGGEL